MMEARSFLRQAHRNANASHVEVRTTIRWGAKRFVVVDYADMDSHRPPENLANGDLNASRSRKRHQIGL